MSLWLFSSTTSICMCFLDGSCPHPLSSLLMSAGLPILRDLRSLSPEFGYYYPASIKTVAQFTQLQHVELGIDEGQDQGDENLANPVYVRLASLAALTGLQFLTLTNMTAEGLPDLAAGCTSLTRLVLRGALVEVQEVFVRRELGRFRARQRAEQRVGKTFADMQRLSQGIEQLGLQQQLAQVQKQVQEQAGSAVHQANEHPLQHVCWPALVELGLEGVRPGTLNAILPGPKQQCAPQQQRLSRSPFGGLQLPGIHIAHHPDDEAKWGSGLGMSEEDIATVYETQIMLCVWDLERLSELVISGVPCEALKLSFEAYSGSDFMDADHSSRCGSCGEDQVCENCCFVQVPFDLSTLLQRLSPLSHGSLALKVEARASGWGVGAGLARCAAKCMPQFVASGECAVCQGHATQCRVCCRFLGHMFVSAHSHGAWVPKPAHLGFPSCAICE